MATRLIVFDNRDDPGNPLVIGKIMVDQVWAEGADPTGPCDDPRHPPGVLLVEFLDVSWG